MDDRLLFKETTDISSECYNLNLADNDLFLLPSKRGIKIQNKISKDKADEYFKSFNDFLFCTDTKLEPAKDNESEGQQDSVKFTHKISQSTEAQSPMKP
jgi:hypothetical protein